MSTTLAAPNSPHRNQKMSQPRHRAILSPFPDKRHVEFYKAEQRRQYVAASNAVSKLSSVGLTCKKSNTDAGDLVNAIVQILTQLKAQGLLSRQYPKGLSQWLEALSDIHHSRELRDSLGRTPADVQTIYRPSARFGQS